MPPFFNKHKDTSPPEPPREAAPETVDFPIPLVASPDALNTDGDSPQPTILLPEPDDKDDLDTAKRLDGAYKVIDDAQNGYAKYQGSTAVKLVNRSGDMLGAIKTDIASAQSFSSPLKPVYESDALKVVRTSVNALVNSLPGLVKALDEVAKLHPFIGIAVGAFRIVVELDLKRRDNDKKIAALFLQMKDMMEALLQLRSIKDHDSVGPGGQTIEARMQNLVKQTADDITACGNACDAYSKKRLVVKVIKGSLWDGTLKGYIDIFAKRRKEFTFALSIHTGIGVDDANRKLDSLDSKMDVLLEFFTTSVTPEYKELAALVQKKGGARAVMDSNETLEELLKFKAASAATTSKQAERDSPEHKSSTGKDDLDALKVELFESPELAIKKNFDVFERKFKMQQRELSEEMRRVVHHEGDRVIEVVTSGSHDRIIDPEIHEIWKEMRWPGHVKARHFVLALRDYYRQQIEAKRRAKGEENPSHIGDDDEWALEWININRLQSIAEAFDDDASGFITVAEVNQFTTARPKGWSLSHWLAYWAIGWQMTATYYRNKVVTLLGKMFAMQSLIHPANARAVEKYLETVYKRVCTLTSSFVCANESDALKARFQSYVEEEEKRLREGLETVRYDIDAMDTLTLITGPGRIEKYLFPLLYLLLKRDYEIFRVCRKMVVHKDELWDSADTLVWVFDAVDFRHNELEVLFKQQNLDPSQQFKAHANELLEFWHDGKKFWSLENLREWEFTEFEYVDAEEDQEVDVSKLLNYPSAADSLYNDIEEIVTENDTRADDDVRIILGRWTGLIGAERWVVTPIVTFSFNASADSASYEASDIAAHGTAYTILGGYTKKEDGSIEYNFTRTYAARLKKMYFTGTLTEDGGTLSGSWGYEDDEKPYRFLFKRIPAETLIARPPPTEFEENKIRALWKYALTAVHNEVRRKMFSWSYLKERRDIKHEYLHLVEREIDNTSTDDDLNRFAVLDRTATCEEVRSFYVLKDYRQRPIPSHFADCDACGERIYGARLMCLKCGSPWTLDFCDKPNCRTAVKTRDDLTEPHLPTHDFVKVRRSFHQYREIGKILRLSEAGLERARKLFSKAARAQAEAAAAPEEGEKAAEAKTMKQAREGAHAAESDSESEPEPEKLTCVSCSATVSYSCWYCIDCPAESNVFVCQECDEKGGVDVGDHKATHSLVHCKEKVEGDGGGDAARNSEERLSAVEGKLAALSVQMERIEKLLDSLAGARSA
ncbi:hypothetical protein TRAPUB_13211 [Trametes pubescens]|uniref:EF-hand domain-containing protein n=1 Tax=Trametes pubescens TaxID=154538 RepID=A0A1M2VRN2_TRAPU|nr:hypothetical protein TRAPUB_13211 [Trametes pubescens]